GGATRHPLHPVLSRVPGEIPVGEPGGGPATRLVRRDRAAGSGRRRRRRLAARDAADENGRYESALVHALHRVASAGTVSLQNGHTLVGGVGAGFTNVRTIMNTTNATIAKSITTPMNVP